MFKFGKFGRIVLFSVHKWSADAVVANFHTS